MAASEAKVAISSVLPIQTSPRGLENQDPPRAFDPDTPTVSVVVQGRSDGPTECYRVASRELCQVSKVLGWSMVVVGAGEFAAGILVFSQWLQEGGWWAGVLGIMLGIVATGLSADTPVGTSLVSWLLALSLASSFTSVLTLVLLDGAMWLDLKDIEACVPSFDDECPASYCTCTTSDQLWDRCFDFGDTGSASDCDKLEGTPPSLLVSSIALLALVLLSLLLLALGIKCKFLGGGLEKGGAEARPNPAKTPSRASYALKTPTMVHQLEEPWGHGESRPADATSVEDPGGASTGATRWAATYVNRLAGRGNMKRRDERNAERNGVVSQ